MAGRIDYSVPGLVRLMSFSAFEYMERKPHGKIDIVTKHTLEEFP